MLDPTEGSKQAAWATLALEPPRENDPAAPQLQGSSLQNSANRLVLGNLVVCSFTKSHSTLCGPMAVACQAPLSMEFSRHEYWSGLPFPSPEALPGPGTEVGYLASPALAI